MVGTDAFRRQQQEDQINRLTVERLEIDRAREPREQAEQLVELGELAVRNGDPVADAGRAELLPLQQNLENGALVLPAQFGRLGSELLQRRRLAIDLECGNGGI